MKVSKYIVTIYPREYGFATWAEAFCCYARAVRGGHRYVYMDNTQQSDVDTHGISDRQDDQLARVWPGYKAAS